MKGIGIMDRICVQDIKNYIDFLISEQKLLITLHGEIAAADFLQYNYHLNPYCQYIKNICDDRIHCLKKQSQIIEKCKSGDFFGVCSAGVGEFIYALKSKNSVIGFISVSGYKSADEDLTIKKIKKYADEQAFPFEEMLNLRNMYITSEIPQKNTIDTLIIPLRFMLEHYYSSYIMSARTNDEKLYMDMCSYIHDNFNRAITMNTLSKQFSYSVSKLSHIFCKSSGMSLSKYIESIRINHAKWMLANTDFTISQISEAIGFCDSSYFSVIFKKCVGITPKKYQLIHGRPTTKST